MLLLLLLMLMLVGQRRTWRRLELTPIRAEISTEATQIEFAA
jgi:hypothetical protein